jgi:hypothetical protein
MVQRLLLRLIYFCYIVIHKCGFCLGTVWKNSEDAQSWILISDFWFWSCCYLSIGTWNMSENFLYELVEDTAILFCSKKTLGFICSLPAQPVCYVTQIKHASWWIFKMVNTERCALILSWILKGIIFFCAVGNSSEKHLQIRSINSRCGEKESNAAAAWWLHEVIK